MSEKPNEPQVQENLTEEELPKNLKTLWLKALSAIELRNYDYSISLLAAVLKEEPRFLHGRKVLRKAEIEKKKSDKRLIKFSTSSFSAVKFQGPIKKDPVAAMVAIEKELEKDPSSPQLNQALFEVAVALELFETAAFALETALEGNPENTKIGHELAEFHMSRDHPDLASEVYQKILEKNPNDIHALQGEKNASARASMKTSWEGKSFREQMKSTGEAADLEQEGRAAMTKDQMEEQIGKLAVQYEEDPNNLAVVKRIANLYEQMEKWEEALTYYDWAFTLSEGDTALEARVGKMRDKHRAQELRHMETEIEEEQDEAIREEKRAKIAQLKGEQAERLVEEARIRVDKNPTDPQLRFELGMHLFHTGNFADAIPELQRAKTNPHLRIRTMVMLGQCYEHKGMDDLAVRQFKEANDELFSMDATKKDVLYHLGLVYAKLKDKENSLESFKQIYEADYGYRDVAKRVEDSYGG